MRDEDIVAAVRAVRDEVPAAWARGRGGWGPAAEALLARAAEGERVDDELLSLLAPDVAVREELGRRLLHEDDTFRVVGDLTGFSPMAGHGEPSTVITYSCRTCGYAYPVFEAGEPVPDGCPDGHGPLVRVV